MTPSPNVNLVLLSIIALIVAHSGFLFSQRRWLLFDPINMFWGGVLICYIEQPISNYSTLLNWHTEEVLWRTLVWILWGLTFVIMGYESNVGSKFARRLPRFPKELFRWRLSFVACVLIVLGLVGYAYDMSVAGGAETWLSVGRGGTDIEFSSAYVRELQGLLPVGVIVLVVQVEMQPVGQVRRMFAWCCGLLMWIWFVYLGTRSRTIIFLSALLAAHYLPRHRNPSPILLAPLFIGLFLLVSFEMQYRGQFTNLSLNLERLDWNDVRDTILPTWIGGGKSGAVDNAAKGMEFNCVATIVELVPVKVEYNYGYGHLEVFTRGIPKSLWPTKRYPHLEAIQGVLREGELTGSTGGTSDLLAGPSLTFAGDWYYVGGPIGLLIGGLLTGILFRMFREYYENSHRSIGTLLVYLQFLGTGFGEAAGTPLLWLVLIPPILICLYVSLWFCEKPTQADGVVRSSANAHPLTKAALRKN